MNPGLGSDGESVRAGFEYDSIAPGLYDAVYHRRVGVRSKWHHLKFERFRCAMRGLRRHLDVGCGPGTLIGSLEADHESVGVDVSAAQIEYARSRYGAAHRCFEQVQPGPLPFVDASFDVVTAVELLEHLDAAAGAMLCAEMHRVLRPGGRLLLSTPNYAGPWPLVEALLNRFGDVSYAEQHVTRYRAPSLRALIETAGFARVEISPYLLVAPFAAVFGWHVPETLRRFEPRWLVETAGLLLFVQGERR